MFESRPELRGRFDAHSLAPERVREHDEVRVPELDTCRSPELPLLLPADHSVAVVAEDQHHERDSQPHGRLELLDIHQEPAVPRDRDHAPLRLSQLCGDRARQPDAHGGKPVGDDHGVRHASSEALRYPQLVRADVRDHEIVGLQRRFEILEDALGEKRKAVVQAVRIGRCAIGRDRF